MCARLPTGTERGGCPEGCWKGPGSLSHLEEAFLSAAAGGGFLMGAFPFFVLSVHLASASSSLASLICCVLEGADPMSVAHITLFDGPSALKW